MMRNLSHLQERRRRWALLQDRLQQRNLVMGILNVTPDSFSDGGRFLEPSRAVERALQMEEEGADLIDIGGESSRPGAEEVSVQEELERIIPVIERIRDRTELPLSVDTYKEEVAREALAAGADLINDISAGTRSPELPNLVAERQGGMILMHMRGTPRTMQNDTQYDDVVEETRQFLHDRIEAVRQRGLDESSIWIDPGIGFGKSVDGNFEILAHLNRYDSLGVGVVIGVSRKSFIGKVLDRPPEQRLFGTVGLTAALATDGIHRIHRVHDVAAAKDCLRMVELFNEARNR